jgi:predicted DNA-binding antitoxin AbrB/MazE fold protein
MIGLEVAMLTVTAVYKGGVLLPATKLNLPDNTQVKVQITALPPASQVASAAFGSLAGIWADLSDDDLARAQQAIARSRQKSSRKVKKLTQQLDRGQRRG